MTDYSLAWRELWATPEGASLREKLGAPDAALLSRVEHGNRTRHHHARVVGADRASAQKLFDGARVEQHGVGRALSDAAQQGQQHSSGAVTSHERKGAL